MKTLLLALAALLLIAPFEAHAGGNAAAKKREQEREKEAEARDKKREAFKEFMEPKDTNRDGSLTREEFAKGETDAEAAGKRFDEYNKNRDRLLSKTEITAMLGLDKEEEPVKKKK
ncbi:MAG TPA: hypothetical protein VFY13_10280 [Luteolibacter sp.]|nr:hypothetical protein [Luteolibacter sp.]